MVECPRCGHQNEDSARNCENCRINLQWALEHPEESLARRRQLEEQQLQEARVAERAANLILTTTFSVEGRTIFEYLDIVATEALADSAFEYRKGRGLTDAVGLTSAVYRTAFGEVRQKALDELRNQALAIGADAVIGMSIDYMPISSSLVMAVARGTAVTLSPEPEAIRYSDGGATE